MGNHQFNGCPICRHIGPDEGVLRGVPLTLSTADAVRLDCTRCGTFEIDNDLRLSFAQSQPGEMPQENALALSCATRDAADRSAISRLTVGNYKDVAAAAPVPRTYGAKVDRLLLWIAHEARYPGMPTPSQPLCGIAARIALPSHALTQLIDLLSGQQMLSTPDGRPESYSIRMFSSGWERVDALQHERAVGTSAFVAMSFADELRSVFDEGIRPALEECRYSGPFRVDDPGHESPRDGKRYEPRIDDRIMAGIRQARVLIVDVTGCRPAVYLEAPP